MVIERDFSVLDKLKEYPFVVIGGQKVYIDNKGNFCIKNNEGVYEETTIEIAGVEVYAILSTYLPRLEDKIYKQVFSHEFIRSIKDTLVPPVKDEDKPKNYSEENFISNLIKKPSVNEIVAQNLDYILKNILSLILDYLTGKKVNIDLKDIDLGKLEGILENVINDDLYYNGKINKKEILGKEYIKVACKKNGTTFSPYLSLGKDSEFMKVDGWYLSYLGKFKDFLGNKVASARLVNENGTFKPCFLKETNEGFKIYKIDGKDVIGINKRIKNGKNIFEIELRSSDGKLETIYFDPITYKVSKNAKNSLLSLFNTKKLDPETGEITTLTGRLVA